MENTPAKPKVTPKDFFLWLGAMVALYISAVSFIILIHKYIEVWFPEEMVIYGDPYSGAIRFAIASLIVMFPLFIWILRSLHKDIHAEPLKKELWVRRWLVFLTLFIAGLAMAIDVIVLINSYLQGELSVRFGLKAAVILAVLAGIFWYFLEELRGTWERNSKLSTAVGSAALILALVSVGSSFFIIGSPESARLMKADEQKIYDLQSIQGQLVYFWQLKQVLPAGIEELNDPISGFTVPVDRETGKPYVYERTSNSSFKLCATFNRESRDIGKEPTEPVRYSDPFNENWQHGAGDVCFDRTIDPERYPPIDKTR